ACVVGWHEPADARLRARPHSRNTRARAPTATTGYHGQSQVLFSGSRFVGNRSAHWASGLRVLEDGPGTHERNRALSRPGIRGHRRVLHGRRPGLSAGLSSPDCFGPRDFRTSWLCPWVSDRLGWNPAAPTANWQGQVTGVVHNRRKGSCPGSAKNWFG